jgi:hypothetical protein
MATTKPGSATLKSKVVERIVIAVVGGIIAVSGAWIKEKWFNPFSIKITTSYRSPDGEIIGSQKRSPYRTSQLLV